MVGGEEGFLDNVSYASSKMLSWKNFNTNGNMQVQQGNHTLAYTLMYIHFDSTGMNAIWTHHMILTQQRVRFNLLL